MGILVDFRDRYSAVKSYGLQDFPIYGSRLFFIQRRLNDWRPQRVREMLVRPYKDPATFYAFWFATLFGLLSILGLAASILQAYASLKAL
jgi:hypothetical protein